MPAPTRPLLTAVALLAAATLTAACGSTTAGSGSPASSGPTGAPPSASPAPSTSAPSSPSPSGPGDDLRLPDDVRERPAVATAIDDAAQRSGVAAAAVTVVAFGAVTWNDGSLGCPQKDMAYTQMTVEGELLVLDVDGNRQQYHGRAGGPYTFCANPTSGSTMDS